ncbi:MAG: HD domain-containing protein [Gemmataceae bacterium]|nr:HD domain-containing protein [Gemmataceae bacterium]
MSDIRLRQAIALEAARLMYERQESEYFTAKRKAAHRVCRGDVKPQDLPSNAEIREQVQLFARLHEGDQRTADLREMRLEALRLMRLLRAFKPRLIGSVMTGHVRKGSDIDLHVFTDHPSLVADLLDGAGYDHETERKRVEKHGEARIFTHIHVAGRFPFELTVYAEDQAHYVFKSSITGKAIERASILELEELLAREYPDLVIDEAMDEAERQAETDPYLLFRLLLAPLEKVQGSPVWHPEGDCLYHSLQVFQLMRDARPYDVELMQAALLHDVGKAIDPRDHVAAGLEALEGLVSERTAWLIAHHMDAHLLRAGSLGHRARQRLEASEDFDDLMLLEECDSKGRERGAEVPTLDEALAFIKSVEEENG